MDWTLLGIEPTKDKKIITTAYRSRLTSVNPEDKPEEFKALRAAYEEALRLADQEETSLARDESPVGLWMAQVRALYDDFPSRIRTDRWQELLQDEVCIALDKRPLAEETLLKFLMEDFYIPQHIWILLDETFSWSQRRSELYEHYSRDFVDYAVLNGIRYPASLPYELFTPGLNAKDCDQYRRLYYRANQVPAAEMGPILDEMAALSERHPYGDALSFRLQIETGSAEQGREGYRALAEAHPNDATLTMAWAAQCIAAGDWAEGEKLTRRVLELRPEHTQAKHALADCLANQGQYEDAKQLIFQLMDDAGGDQKRIYELRNIIRSWNEALIQQREARLSEAPEDMENRVKLAWCYLQNDRDSDALELCQSISSDYEDQYDYFNVQAKVHYAANDYAAALSHLEQMENLLRSMVPDGTEKTEKRLKSLPENLQMQGSCLFNLGDRNKAIQKYEQALALAPNSPEVLTHMGRLLCLVGELNRAVDIFDKLTAVLPGSYHGFFLLSQTLYDLGRDQAAFDAINRALELERGDLAVYVLKMRILIRNGVWEGVHNILDFLHQNGITDELSVLWCEAQLTEFEQKNKEHALEQYRAIAHRLENGEQLPWGSAVYLRITTLVGEHKDARKEEDRAEMLAILDKGLALDKNDSDCMDYKAWLLKRGNRNEEALELYHKLEKLPRRNLNVEQELAELYYRNLSHDADKALHYYQILLDNNEHPDYHFYAGTCRRYLKDWEGAEQNFLREQELSADDVDGYNGLGLVYEAMNRYEDSLAQANRAIELVKDRQGDQSRFYFRKVQILRRLGRAQEAAETVDELTGKYGCDHSEQLKFDIYCQFGLWERARDQLAVWRKSGRLKARQAAAEVKLNLFTGQLAKAKFKLLRVKKSLNERDLENLQLQIAELEGDLQPQVKIWKKRMKDTDDTHALMNLAQAYCWDGNISESRKYAQWAVEALEKQLKLYLKDEALYRSRYAMALALLGRMEEARTELATVRAMALCEGCDYGSCKDADIFEANMEEVCGNYRKAMELHQAGLKKWPDDLDFAAGAARMKRKGF